MTDKKDKDNDEKKEQNENRDRKRNKQNFGLDDPTLRHFNRLANIAREMEQLYRPLATLDKMLYSPVFEITEKMREQIDPLGAIADQQRLNEISSAVMEVNRLMSMDQLGLAVNQTLFDDADELRQAMIDADPLLNLIESPVPELTSKMQELVDETTRFEDFVDSNFPTSEMEHEDLHRVISDPEARGIVLRRNVELHGKTERVSLDVSDLKEQVAELQTRVEFMAEGRRQGIDIYAKEKVAAYEKQAAASERSAEAQERQAAVAESSTSGTFGKWWSDVGKTVTSHFLVAAITALLAFAVAKGWIPLL